MTKEKIYWEAINESGEKVAGKTRAELHKEITELKQEKALYEQYIEYCDYFIESNKIPVHFVQWREKIYKQ
jgi:hypothetical protein